MSRNLHRILELSEQRCWELLTGHRTRLGRVAFAEDRDPDWPSILPVNYAVHGRAVYFRTFEGSKLFAALRGQRVAFEVDGVDSDWQEGWSVVLLGPLTLVEDVAEEQAVEAVLWSWAAGETERLVRLDPEHVSGRELIGRPPST